MKSEGHAKQLHIRVVGAERAPNLIAYLRNAGASIEEAPRGFEDAVRSGDLPFVLTIPPDYGKDFGAGRTAKLELTVDQSHSGSHGEVRRIEGLLSAYGDHLAGLRLMARGVSPALALPITVEEIDLATPEKMAGFVLGMIPMFLLVGVFAGGLHLAIDATAGERERGSLEPLLLNPVSLRSVILGKWAAVVVTAFGVVMLTIVGFAIVLHHLPLEQLGIRADVGVRALGLVVAILVPLVLFASALLVTMSLFARTYKEAQTYLSLVIMLPTLSAAVLSLSPAKAKHWMMLVPVWGQTLMLSDVVRGESIGWGQLALAAGAAVSIAALLLAQATRMLSRETIVFGRSA
jgi:sodium transport system permease protein